MARSMSQGRQGPGAIFLFVVPLTVLAVAGARFAGLGEGLVLAVTPASGLALAAGVLWRWTGIAAAATGYLLAGLASGLGLQLSLGDALAHGGGAALATATMLAIVRQTAATPVRDILAFFAGVVVFTGTVAVVVAAAAHDGTQPVVAGAWRPEILVLVFEPFGILTCATMVFNLRHLRGALADPTPTLGILAVGFCLTGILAVVLQVPGVSASGAALLLSTPFCLWVAMQRRSADGSALSFVAGHAVVLLVFARTGGLADPGFVTAVLYLDLLVATCQLVHAVNLDRLGAIAALEVHQQQLEERVIQRTAQLKAMTERAIQADEAKTRFLATTSHEVRTPLNGVIGMASVVLAGRLDPQTRTNVEMIRNSGLHLLEVINRILDFSKLDHGLTASDILPFDLPQLVEEVLSEARFSRQAEGLALRSEIEPGLAPLRVGYRHGVRQILTNLVGNATKFTEAGHVTVRVTARDGGLRLAVEDSGIGVPAEVQARIFLPFEQADGSMTRRFGGTGLGLAICAELAERMDGSIGIESSPGQGATFWVDLPLPPARRKAPGTSRASA